MDAVLETLREIPGVVPWIRSFSVEKTLVWCGTQAVVLIAEFDSQADWERYMHEPGRLALGDRIKDTIDLSHMTVLQTTA